MPRRIGLIQSCNLGDIIIALPIAQHFIERGDEVIWPVFERWLKPLSAADPTIQFLPLPNDDPDNELGLPMQLLREHECDPIIPVMSHVCDLEVPNSALLSSLKFDEYKYAVAGVAFGRKWMLKLQRNVERELALFNQLALGDEPYVALHDTGSTVTAKITLPEDWVAGRRVVRVEPLTDNPFDWLTVFERASHLVMIDSCFANLVEQLNLPNPKTFLTRSDRIGTPVLKNQWEIVPRKLDL